MSPYEQAHLFKEMVDSGGDNAMNYISVLFAFLVAGYLIGPHLNRVMTGIIVGLFTLFAGLMILTVNRTVAGIAAFAGEMRRMAGEDGGTMAWHPVVYEPFNVTEIFLPVLTALLFASYIAALVFFFASRKRKLGDTFSL